MNKKIFKVIAPSLLAMAVAGGTIAGATYALFTSESKSDIAITSGKVQASAAIEGIKLYSADPTLTEGELVPGSDDVGVYSHAYYYREMPNLSFLDGGTASYSAGNLTLDRMAPGDMIKAKFAVTNDSNIAVKYRLVCECTSTEEKDLRFFSNLVFEALGYEKTNVRKYATNWTVWDIPATPEEKVIKTDLKIAMPLKLSDYFQQTQTAIRLSVEMVQANAYTADTADEILVFKDDIVLPDETKPSGMADMVMTAGGTDDQPTVKVEIPTGTLNEVTAGGQNVEEYDILSLSVVESEASPVVVVESDEEAKNFEVSLVNQNDEKIESTNTKLRVSIYVGENKEIVKVYHKDVEIPAYDGTNEGYVYENGYVIYYTSSFSPFSVVYKALLKGSGTAEDPYVVGSKADLKALSSYKTGYFKVTEDIEFAAEDLVEVTEDLTGEKIDCIVNELIEGAVIDFDGHEVVMNSGSEEGIHAIFRKTTSTIIKNAEFVISGRDATVSQYAINTTFDNVSVDGDIMYTSGNQGVFTGYTRYNVNLNKCIVKADVCSVTGDTSMYNAVFLGYGMSTGTITMTDCSNEGSFISGKAGLIMANWPYSARLSFVLNNVKNNGLVKSTNSEFYGGAGKYNYLTADYWDKAYCLNFTIDGGAKMTDVTSPKWYEIAGQSGVVGTGQFVAGSDDATLSLAVNADKTFTITPSSKEGVSYYVISTGIYAGTEYGSARFYATEKITSGLVSTLKDLRFVDAEWLVANPSAVEGTLAGNTIYTLADESFYMVTEAGWSLGGVACNSGMISVSAFNANDVLVSSYSLVNA